MGVQNEFIRLAGAVLALTARELALLLHQRAANAVLEIASGGSVADALVHDAETEHVARGCDAVARKGADAFHGAGLGFHVALGCGAAHAFAKCSVLSGYGEGGEKVAIDVAVTIGEAEQADEKLGGEIVIEREARTIGNLIVGGVEAYCTDKVFRDLHRATAGGGTVAVVGGDLIEHGFGHRVVASLHHGEQHLVDGVATGAERGGRSGHGAFADAAAPTDVGSLEGLTDSFGEAVAIVEEEGGEGDFIVVPTPSPAPTLVVLEGEVGQHVTIDGEDAVGLE